MFRKISTWFDENKRQLGIRPTKKNDADSEPHRHCFAQNCHHHATHRAPRTDGTSIHQHPETWLWFCDQHITEFNMKWNYYQGMNEQEAYASYKGDVGWNRPTWPMGRWGQSRQASPYALYQGGQQFHDPFDFFNGSQPHPSKTKKISSKEHEALRLMGLNHPFTLDQLQFVYRQMVKRYHPDLNHDDPQAEEKFKNITLSYQILKKLHEFS